MKSNRNTGTSDDIFDNHKLGRNDRPFNPYTMYGQPVVLFMQKCKTVKGYQVKGNVNDVENNKCSEHSDTHRQTARSRWQSPW